jgi:6-phosphogluconate dehydrogenase (decarboxylating)
MTTTDYKDLSNRINPAQASKSIRAYCSLVGSALLFHIHRHLLFTKMLCDIGLYGLAVMGQNFALNMAEHGYTVAVCNRSPAKVDDTVARAQAEGNLPVQGYKDVAEFCAALQKPRKIILLVQAGAAVDASIALLAQHLEPEDILIDGGNEWYPNQLRRYQELAKQKIHFIGMGISGGEEGARNGPSLMPGGDFEAWKQIEDIMMKCAAHVDDEAIGAVEPCTGYLGPIGAGNYVKMVHNGIEYGDMQLIAEVYDILKVSIRRFVAAYFSTVANLAAAFSSRMLLACPMKKWRMSLPNGTRKVIFWNHS